MDIYDFTEKVANSISDKKPTIWDDTQSYDAHEDFDYTCDVLGNWNEGCEVIWKETEGKCVVAWKWLSTPPTTDDLGTIIPVLMTKGKHSVPYKKYDNCVGMWETEYKGYECQVLTFATEENNNGETNRSFWYIVTIK